MLRIPFTCQPAAKYRIRSRGETATRTSSSLQGPSYAMIAVTVVHSRGQIIDAMAVGIRKEKAQAL